MNRQSQFLWTVSPLCLMFPPPRSLYVSISLIALCLSPTGVKLFLGLRVPCMVCFEVFTAEGRGGEKGGSEYFKTTHRTFGPRNTSVLFIYPSLSSKCPSAALSVSLLSLLFRSPCCPFQTLCQNRASSLLPFLYDQEQGSASAPQGVKDSMQTRHIWSVPSVFCQWLLTDVLKFIWVLWRLFSDNRNCSIDGSTFHFLNTVQSPTHLAEMVETKKCNNLADPADNQTNIIIHVYTFIS